MIKNLKVQIIKTDSTEAIEAVFQLQHQIKIKKIAGIIFFCSSNYNLDELSIELSKILDGPIYGCTTAGEISDTYSADSIVALVLNAEYFAVHANLISDFKNFDLIEAMKIAGDVEKNLVFSQNFITNKTFGFLLSDGLSFSEEKITQLLYQAMEGINILGGSIADDFKLKQTHVYFKNQFIKSSTVLLTVEIKDSFGIFKMQHFEPTDKEIITTKVNFSQRIVEEINGEPAALAYAKINQIDLNDMSNIDFAMHPLMLHVANKWYIRSISKILPNNSLQFHCAIDFGLPLNVGKGKNLVAKLEEEVLQIIARFDEIYFTLGCDCILRKLEIFDKNHTRKVEKLLEKINFIGFNSYGEQYNGIHFNQTMIGITVGKAKNTVTR